MNVGAYLRAQRMIESARPARSGKGYLWRWTLPRHFPPGKSLRVVFDRGKLEQAGVLLQPDASGAYSVALDAQALRWSP